MLLLKNNASIDTYDSNGNIATEAKSAVTQSYTYNRDGTVASIVTTNNIDNTSETTTYTYYLNGNLKTETLPDNTTKTYTYNNRDMLVTEALSTGKTTTYAYNNSGNRTSKTVTQNSQNTVTSYTYDNANRLTQEQTGSTSISYTYDDNGRLISRTSGSVTDTFAYNGYNEMKKAVVGGVTTDYTYYVDGLRRSKKTGNNTSYEFWDGDNIIADTVSGYTIANNYIRGLRLAEIDDGTATRQYTFNAHGDVTGLVDTTTGAVTDYTYDAYGNEDNASATDTNPFRYSGEYYDAETGFIYLRARYYDPSIGRFTAEDTHWTSENMVFGDREYQPNEIKIPSIEAIKQAHNLYLYCLGNPVKYIDQLGEKVRMVGSQLAAQLGIKLGTGSGYIWDDLGNVAKVDQFSFGAGLDVGINASGYYAVFETDSIFDIKGASFEIGGSVSPMKIGPLSVGAGYEYSVSIGENKFDGNIYSATAGASLLPVDGHAQISFSAFDSRIETILATILLKTLKTVFDR